MTYTNEEGIANFLEQNGIKKAEDPLEDVFRITRRALFEEYRK